MKRNVTLPIILFVITFYYIISSISAQVLEPQNYDNDVVNISNATSGTCNNCNIGNIRFWPANNIPNVNSIVKIVKVDFNILQNGSGGGNFINSTTDAQNGIPRLNNILGWINNYYNNNAASNIIPLNVTVNNLPKEDIQFELGNIYFYNNATYWKSSNVSTLLNLVINDVSRNPNAVNDRLQLFFSEGWYNGSILSHITVTNGGSGYTSPPNVSFASPSNAQATAQISNGSVVSITITSGDTIEYSSTNDPTTHYGAPDVTISGGGGAGATAFVDKIGGGAAAYAPIPNCVLSNQGYVLAFGAFHGDLNPDHTLVIIISITRA